MDIEGIEFGWLGHDSFRIKADGKIIYTDPYLVSEGEKADLILITHEHYDHCDPDSVKILKKDDTIIISSAGGVKKLGEGKVMKAGQNIKENGVEIKAVSAYNMGKPYHPEEFGIGFIFKIAGKTIYHCGDTDFIQEMAEFGEIDIALISIGGKFVMNEKEAVQAVEVLKPKYVIPMHYGTITEGDAERFRHLVGDKAKVVIMKME